MLIKMLEYFDDEEYVYVIDGHNDIFVAYEPAGDEPCETCGEWHWSIAEGYVKDLKKINTMEDLHNYVTKKNELSLKK